MKTLAFATTVFLAVQGAAFTLNSSSNPGFKGWSSSEIKFQLNLSSCPAGVDVRGIIGDALAVWNNVASSKVKLSMSDDTTSTTYSDPITIVCDTNYGATSPGAADGSPGAASVYPGTGDSITAGIMYLNASTGRANIANLSRALVAVVLAHEIGHLIGLGHSQDVNALMYYDASAKSQLRLAQDDVDAISYLYPRDETGGDKMAGCGRLGQSGGGSGPMVVVLFLLPLAILLNLRRLAGLALSRYPSQT